MKIGMHYFWHNGSPEKMLADAQRSEAIGFDLFGLTDSQLLFRDIYSSLALVANNTEDLVPGPMVTNPVTRHPAVTAGGICSIAELADRGAVLGIGTGHSAVDSVGKTPATLSEIEDAVSTIRSLCRGKEVEYDGSTYALDWVRHEHEGFTVPIIMAAEGPKMQRLAGEIADGVIFNGPHPDLVRDSISRITTAAENVGRDPADIEKWVKVRANVADDRSAAIAEIETSLANYANVSLKIPSNRKTIPDSYRDQIESFMAEYKSHSGYHDKNTANDEIISELGLSGFFADRFAIVGTPSECITQIRELEQIGADGVLMATEPDIQRRFIEKMGSDVLSSL
ncbi:LLM class flavin-dependent oxidoreductase [Natrinema halophilum]|uniref:LLM class flavin-dependent oxidoreductase n=1 Tax=Natrinema halophilum TaxID=1699371 RepID=UPI001F3F48DF|nr:LLM class flavin-dependent oxidoreductase [Natrinema halophilum]UHQ96370.1 LLM class flavin-dependent oxidoreductase [Natrinema halophilum]